MPPSCFGTSELPRVVTHCHISPWQPVLLPAATCSAPFTTETKQHGSCTNRDGKAVTPLYPRPPEAAELNQSLQHHGRTRLGPSLFQQRQGSQADSPWTQQRVRALPRSSLIRQLAVMALGVCQKSSLPSTVKHWPTSLQCVSRQSWATKRRPHFITARGLCGPVSQGT